MIHAIFIMRSGNVIRMCSRFRTVVNYINRTKRPDALRIRWGDSRHRDMSANDFLTLMNQVEIKKGKCSLHRKWQTVSICPPEVTSYEHDLFHQAEKAREMIDETGCGSLCKGKDYHFIFPVEE